MTFSGYRDVILKRKEQLNAKLDKKEPVKAVITDELGNDSGTGSVWSDQSTRRVWIKLAGSSSISQVPCYTLTPVIGLGVIVGYPQWSNVKQVLQTDIDFLGATNTTGTSYESPSNIDFLPGGRLQLWVQSKLIQPLATYPNDTGLTVNVTSGDYPYNGARVTFPGEISINLSGSQPSAGQYRFVGIYLDSSNTLQTIDGTAGSSATPDEPSWPAGAFRLSVVRLYNPQTKIVFTKDTDSANDVFDRRMAWSDENGGGGGWPFDNVFTVSTTNPGADFASIQDANDDSGVGSGDALALDAETFSEALTISKALAIVAAMLGQCVITDATNSAPTLNNSSADVRLTGLTIYHTGAGTTAGCLYSASNNFFADLCTFSKTSGASGTAYGLWINSGSNVTVNNCTLVASSGSGSNFGGYITGGAVTLTNCNVTGGGSGTVRSLYITGGSVVVNGGYYVGSLEHDNVSGSIDLRGPTLVSGFTNTAGTARGWYYDAGGNVNFVGSSVVSGLDKAAVSKLWESDSGAVAWQTDTAGELSGNGTRDIFPQASVNGLNARFERLFGDDVPANAYLFTRRTFVVNNVGSNIIGFEDNQSSPYSPPTGNFTITTPSNSFSPSSSHFLQLRNDTAGNPVYLQWTNSTAKNLFSGVMAVSPLVVGTDTLVAEWRFWAVQSPGANDRWWAIRWVYYGSTKTQFPLQVSAWYSAAAGDGLTFAATTGTKFGEGPFYPGLVHSVSVNIVATTTAFFNVYTAEGFGSFATSGVVASMPSSVKTARLMTFQQYNSQYLDQMVIT